MVFFTSDTHFFHKQLLSICRPEFKTVEEMNEAIVTRWNTVVHETDVVWHLGDVTFGKIDESIELIQRLNGYKMLVRGNHDHGSNRLMRMGFQAIFEQAVVNVGGHQFLLAHYPYAEGQLERHIAKYGPMFTTKTSLPLICGHVHAEWKRLGKMLNVGMEVSGYTPVSADTVLHEFKLTV